MDKSAAGRDPAANDEDVATLRARLNELTGRNNELTGRNNELTGANNALVGRVNALTDINNRLTGENNRLFAESQELRESVGRLRELVAEIEGGHLLLRAADATDVPPFFADAALTVEDALRQASGLVRIARRIGEGFYRDRLIVVACLEKSGSTTLEMCLREMLLRSGGVPHDIGIQKRLEYGPFSFVGTLYPEILLYAPEGGVLRGVIRPTRDVLDLLRVWQCRSVVLMRHPADRLVGRYCDPSPPRLEGRGRVWRADPQCLFPDVYQPWLAAEEAFRVLIEDGYLLDTLDWMAAWCRVASDAGAQILRYEDLIAEGPGALDDLHRLLYGRAMDEDLSGGLAASIAAYPDRHQSGDVEGRRYPSGYSGEIGVWRSYFSEANATAYRNVVDTFLNHHPGAAQVAELYPDLRL